MNTSRLGFKLSLAFKVYSLRYSYGAYTIRNPEHCCPMTYHAHLMGLPRDEVKIPFLSQ